MALSYKMATHQPLQIGMVVLQADETLEADMRRLLPVSVECLVSRVPSGDAVTPESLRAMEDRLTAAAALLPRGATLSAVGYGCTSATAELGAAHVANLIKVGARTPHVTDPVTALIGACHELGLSRIGLVSPYIASVSDRLRAVLADAGITVTSFGSFDEAEEARVVRIAPSSVRDAALNVGDAPECEALFLSCTNLRTLDLIDDLEAALGKPVLSSNQVLAWHLGRLAGFAPNGPGRLLSER